VGRENATGIDLLGTKTVMAGFVPPPGVYFIDVNYRYSGNASGTAAKGVAPRRLDNIGINVKADVNLDADALSPCPSCYGLSP
jgi:hypothetical protein